MDPAARIVDRARSLVEQGEPALVAFERACSEVGGPRAARRLAARVLEAISSRGQSERTADLPSANRVQAGDRRPGPGGSIRWRSPSYRTDLLPRLRDRVRRRKRHRESS